MISLKAIKALSVLPFLKLFFILKFTQKGPPGGLDDNFQRGIVWTRKSMKGGEALERPFLNIEHSKFQVEKEIE